MKTKNRFFDIDTIVYDSEGLIKAINEGFKNIGLCDNVFHIPSDCSGINFSGVGNASAIVYTNGLDSPNSFSAIDVKRVIIGAPNASERDIAEGRYMDDIFLSSFGSGSYLKRLTSGSGSRVRGSGIRGSGRGNNNNNNNNGGSGARGSGSYTLSRSGAYIRLGSSYSGSFRSSGRVFTAKPHTGPWGRLLDELFGPEMQPGGYGLELI